MATPIFSISGEMQDVWNDIMVQMEAFVNDTNADVDMAYDWVCEMLDIDSFVDNEIAWNSFYNCWESCDNRNDRPFFHEYNFAWLMYTDPCTIALSFMRYSVHCPSAPYENSSFVDIDDAWGLCLDLSEEFGYAEVRQGEHLLGSYTNGQWVSDTNPFVP